MASKIVTYRNYDILIVEKRDGGFIYAIFNEGDSEEGEYIVSDGKPVKTFGEALYNAKQLINKIKAGYKAEGDDIESEYSGDDESGWNRLDAPTSAVTQSEVTKAVSRSHKSMLAAFLFFGVLFTVINYTKKSS